MGGLVASYLMKGLTKLWKIHINIMKLEEGKSFLIHQIHQFFSYTFLLFCRTSVHVSKYYIITENNVWWRKCLVENLVNKE